MIDNPQAVKFCNEHVRVLADRVAGIAVQIQSFGAMFAAKGLAELIPNDETPIDDGSKSDGRTPITGADVWEMLALAKTLGEMATGPDSKIATVLKVSVNPR